MVVCQVPKCQVIEHQLSKSGAHPQQMPPFRWEDIDHSLVSLKLTESADDIHRKITEHETRIRFENRHNLNDGAIPSLILRMKQEHADGRAQQVYEIYCDVWRTQGHAKSADFLRAVSARAIRTTLRACACAIAGEFLRLAKRTSLPDAIRDAHLLAHELKMQRLQGRWERRLEAEAKECDHGERTKNLSTNAVSGTSSAPLCSDEGTNLSRTPDRRSPAVRNARSPSLDYRSELKRAVALHLTKDPNASDLSICRGLDADGAVELPESLTGGVRERLFVAAYKDPRRRHALENTFSKVRADMRDRGLLGKKQPGRHQ